MKDFVSWELIDDCVTDIAFYLKDTGKIFKGVFGIPRGGSLLAVMLSHKMNIPYIDRFDDVNESIIIIDDIVDTGKTMFEILLRVNDMKPSDVKIVTLLKRKKNSPPVDHFCFEIDKEWVVGYGLDDNGLKRNYRNIYKIN